MKALILVDIQNDFLPGGALAVPHGDEIIAVANRLMDHFDLVVATQDWHPPDHGSFAGNHPGTSVGDVVDFSGIKQVLWPDHCVQDSPGAELAEKLHVDRVERVFRKGTDPGVDSYSAFFDNAGRATGLSEFLNRRQVDDVFIAGLATDYCVKATALDACREGFRAHVVLEAVRGVDVNPGDVTAALEEMRSAGARLVHETDVAGLATQLETLVETKFLRLVRRGRWDFVQRTGQAIAVGLVATTDDNRLLLVEQYRPPVAAPVVELPAGLVGDVPGEEHETPETAARRELVEETGYEATDLTRLVLTASSAGLSDESVLLLRARDVRRIAAGGGDEAEQITVHAVPLTEIDAWLDQRIAAGQLIDGRVFAAVYFVRREASAE
jgi:nicotinamidase/pyrazinamidase